MPTARTQAGPFFHAIALILVPTVGLVFLGLLLIAGEDTAIVNGAVLPPMPLGRDRWIVLIPLAIGWLWAVTAGVVALTGVKRGLRIGPVTAAKQAIRKLPAIFMVFLSASFLLGPAALLAKAMGIPTVLVDVVLLIVFARLLLVIPVFAMGLDGFWRLSSGRSVLTVVSAAAGIMAPMAVLSLAITPVHRTLTEGWLPGGAVIGALAVLLLSLGIFGVVALQTFTLSNLFLDLIEDTTAADALLGGLPQTGQPTVRWRAAVVAGIAVPALLSAGVAVANPYDQPEVTANELDLYGIYAVGWPAGQHPIIVHSSAILDCLDEQCRDYAERPGHYFSNEHGFLEVTPSGNVLAARSHHTGKIEFTTCTRSGACQTGTISGLPWQPVVVAVAEAADGGYVLATAHSRWNSDLQMELAFIHCANIDCASPKRTVVGVLPKETDDPKSVRLELDAQGRPSAVFNFGHSNIRATCDPHDCRNPRHASLSEGGPLWAQLEHARAASVRPLALTVVAGKPQAVISQPVETTWGTRLQTVLWQCLDPLCTAERKIPLRITEDVPRDVFIMSNADGRLLIVESGEQNVVYTVAAS